MSSPFSSLINIQHTKTYYRPADVEKLTAFVADPRPLAEKQAEFMEEIESRVVTYIEKGTAIEGDIIAAIPEPIKDALPQPVKDVILAPRPSSNTDNDDAIFAYPPTTASSNSTSNNNNGNLSTWTISSIDEGDARFPSTAVGGGNSDDAEFNGPPEIPGAAFMNNQVAAELVEIQTAVVSVKDALEALKSNTEPAKEGMLRLNLREAAQGLSGRLQQTRPGSRTSDSAVDAAIVEAEGLLGEVNALV